MHRILAIMTTTHDPAKSTSWALGKAALQDLQRRAPYAEVRVIDANKLHIVKNLSCYANGKRDCANPEAGPYRCWAHYESLRDPAKYGGVDQMPIIYDGLKWADTVVFCTSTRWGNHSALAQTVIERMNTLENRGAAWGEPYPMAGKRLGVIAGGLHWQTARVTQHLAEVFRWFRFNVPDQACLAWQFTSDVNYEQLGTLLPSVDAWLRSPQGMEAVATFSKALMRGTG
jgi:NAD(P)H-dependent FMN reductase